MATSESLSRAFRRMRRRWKALYDATPESDGEREAVLRDLQENLPVIVAGARLSAEAVEHVETTFRARRGELDLDESAVPQGLLDISGHLREGLEALLRALQQMEIGDEILPESGRDMRRNAARSVAYFVELRRIGREDDPSDEEWPEDTAPREPREEVIERLTQSYDARRKQVREDVEIVNPAIEAVDFLLRLGAG